MGRALARAAAGGFAALALIAGGCAHEAAPTASPPDVETSPGAVSAPTPPVPNEPPVVSQPAPGEGSTVAPDVARDRTVVAHRVPGVGEVLVLAGDPDAGGVALYLHGRCGDPEAFRAFAGAIPHELTFISVRGDVRCKGSPRSRWSGHVAGIDQRLRRVVAAVSDERVASGAVPLADDRWLVFGYSEGALRAEALLARYSDRYVVGVLGGAPRPPRPGSLDRAGGVVLLAGELDVRGPLQDAAHEHARAGRRVRFAILPAARHGEYGPDAERVVGDALRWLLAGPPFTEAGSTFQK